MAGARRGSRPVMRTVPRLVGLRLQTLAVIAGKVSRGWPKAGRLSGCTWYSMLGCSNASLLRVKAQSWEGAMLMGPERVRAYSRPIFALPTRLLAMVLRVFAPFTLSP